MAVNRTIKVAGREVTRMGMGTNRLTPTPENLEHVRQAVAAGIGMIDTAHLYSGGTSEQAIGEALAGESARPLVATKGGFGRGEGRPDVLRSQIEQSLRSAAHEPDRPLLPPPGRSRDSDRGQRRGHCRVPARGA